MMSGPSSLVLESDHQIQARFGSIHSKDRHQSNSFLERQKRRRCCCFFFIMHGTTHHRPKKSSIFIRFNPWFLHKKKIMSRRFVLLLLLLIEISSGLNSIGDFHLNNVLQPILPPSIKNVEEEDTMRVKKTCEKHISSLA